MSWKFWKRKDKQEEDKQIKALQEDMGELYNKVEEMSDQLIKHHPAVQHIGWCFIN